MQTGPEKQMISMFEEAIELSSQFKKATYEPTFRGFFERRRPELARILKEIREKDEGRRKQLIQVLGTEVPEYASKQLHKLSDKRKRENRILDYNLALVTFFIPLLLYSRDPELEAVADEMISSWNRIDTVTMKVGKSTFEEINGGFRKRLCYVTTAVCRSLQKPDECYELKLLREYRDGYLVSSEGGKETIREYYNIAPTIVKRIERMAEADVIYQKIWEEYLNPCIHLIEAGELAACRTVYTNMIQDLEQDYLFS